MRGPSSQLSILFVLLVVSFSSPTDATAQFLEGDVEVIHSLSGDNVGDNFGYQACAIADYNGDGAMEFLVSAAFVDTPVTDAGVVHLYDGASGTIIRSHYGSRERERRGYVCDAGDVNADGIIDYLYGTNDDYVYVHSGVDGTLLYEFSGIPASMFGFRACGLGDLDGDGYGEILIGAWSEDGVTPNEGRAYLYSGKDATLIRTHQNGITGSRFGHTVSLIGDLDGDDIPDYSVGAPGPWSTNFIGRIYVYSGQTGNLLYEKDPKATGLVLAGWQQCQGLQDFNGDDVPDFTGCDIGDYRRGSETGRLYLYDGATGQEIRTITGFRANSGFGGTPWTPAGSIGDIDGDCIDDLLVASWKSQDGAPNAGQAHLLSGRDATVLRSITSTRPQANFAGTLAGAGDVNGDGVPDYIFAANGDSNQRGAVWVIAGHDYDNRRGPLSLSANTCDPTAGATLSLEVGDGLANESMILAVISSNGTPIFAKVADGAFDGSGRWQLDVVIPPSLGGMKARIQAFGHASSGTIGASNQITLHFH